MTSNKVCYDIFKMDPIFFCLLQAGFKFIQQVKEKYESVTLHEYESELSVERHVIRRLHLEDLGNSWKMCHEIPEHKRRSREKINSALQ